MERQAADHLLAHRVAVGRLQLRPLSAGWGGTGRQVPGGGTGPERLLAVLRERGALPGGIEAEVMFK